MGIENPVHLLFIAVVALLVLGPKRLPEVARTLGKGLREFRAAMDGTMTHAEHPPPAPQAQLAATAPTADSSTPVAVGSPEPLAQPAPPATPPPSAGAGSPPAGPGDG